MDLIMRRMDKNQDHKISLEEFVSFFNGDEEEQESQPDPICCGCWP